jgi:hypothetical protein
MERWHNFAGLARPATFAAPMGLAIFAFTTSHTQTQQAPTMMPTSFPTFALPPPELFIEPLQQGEQVFSFERLFFVRGYCRLHI